MRKVILVIEDDIDLANFLREVLTDELYTVHVCESGVSGLQTVESVQPDLVLMDLGLPDIDGKTVCKKIKDLFPQKPVIVLTASEESTDLVQSFQLGADDYIQKPFEVTELLARIQARIVAANSQQRKQLRIGDLQVDTEKVIVSRGGTEIELTQTEYELLVFLLENAQRVLSREQILSHVWAQDPDVETRVVDVYIGYLRKKLGETEQNKVIHSKRGFGYVIKET